MAKKPANTAKVVVWTPRTRLEMEGPTSSVCFHVFQTVPDDQRDQLLKDMSAWSEEVK